MNMEVTSDMTLPSPISMFYLNNKEPDKILIIITALVAYFCITMATLVLLAVGEDGIDSGVVLLLLNSQCI